MAITNCYHRRGMIHTHMKPIDYIGLYILVTVATMASVNGLFRIYF